MSKQGDGSASLALGPAGVGKALCKGVMGSGGVGGGEEYGSTVQCDAT